MKELQFEKRFTEVLELLEGKTKSNARWKDFGSKGGPHKSLKDKKQKRQETKKIEKEAKKGDLEDLKESEKNKSYNFLFENSPSTSDIEKIKGFVSSKGSFKTARMLINSFIKKISGGAADLSILPDTSSLANGVDSVSSFLDEGDYESAWAEAKNTASDILYDEGFPMEGDEFTERFYFKR
jgi:hypothetical protein